MSEHLHPGVHPDADSLNGFVEGVLPEHERAQCLAHLAECSVCRDVVFLAQETPVVPISVAMAPVRRRWFRAISLLAAAAVVFVVLLGAWLYLRPRADVPPHDIVARVTPSLTTPTPVDTPVPKPTVRKTAPGIHPRRVAVKPSPVLIPVPPEPARTTPASNGSEVANSSSLMLGTELQLPIAPRPPILVIPAEVAIEASPGISGTVTDATGATVPRAAVQLRQLASGATFNTQTDQAGEFKFSGLAPGQYELLINVPGFRRAIQRVEVQPREVASVKSELQVGSVSEMVDVTAASSTLQTMDSSVSSVSLRKQKAPRELRPLPSNLPIELRVMRGKVIVATDSAGALFYSGNSGWSWKAVKAVWQGKVDDLVGPPDVPRTKAKFQLTTDGGSVWSSRDGRHWYADPLGQ